MGGPSRGRAGLTALVIGGSFALGACAGEEHLGPVPIQKSRVKIFPSELDLDALAELGRFTAQRTDGQGRPSNLNRFQWRSLNPNIAQVDGAGRVVSLSPGTATIEVSAGVETARAEVVVDQAPVHFAVGPRADTLDAIGQSLTLSFEARDKNGFRVPRTEATWESRAPTIITVDHEGTVTSRDEGEAEIRVRKRGRRDSVRVRVRRKANTISVLPRVDTLTAIGQEARLRAYATNSSGDVVANSGFTWASSDPGVVSVTSNGIVEARGTGSANVSARLGSLGGEARVIVHQTVEGVEISPASASIPAPDQTVQLTAAGSDEMGGDVGTAFSWNSDRPEVATVNGSGLVTGVSHGTARISAAAPSGAKGFATVSVGTVLLNVRPKADTLSAIGATTQFAIYPTDSEGSEAYCPSPAWKSLDPTVATVDQLGKTVGKAIGTALIIVSACTVQDTASVTVLASGGGGASPPPPPPPPPSSTADPELPRVIPDTARASVQRSVKAHNASELQAAVTSARAGDEILLDPGVVYRVSGGLALPPRSDGGWVVIRTDLPGVSRGARIDSTLNLATITCSGANCSTIHATGSGDHGYRLEVVELTSGTKNVTALVRLGSGGAGVPDRFIFDRVYAHAADPTWDLRRCFQANASNLAVLRSVIVECHQRGNDSQGIAAWNTPGPILVSDNLLSASTIPFLLGGADPANAGNVPHDVTFARNHVWRPNSWKGGPWTVKNLFELKMGIRVHVWGNVFENHWRHAQHGPAILLKTANQGGGTGGFTETGHVTFERNILRNVDMGFNLSRGSSATNPQVPMHDVLIQDVVCEQCGPNGDHGGRDSRNFQIQGPDNLTIRRYTNLGPNMHSALEFVTQGGSGLTLESIVVRGPTSYGLRIQPISQWYRSAAMSNLFAVNDSCSRYSSTWSCPSSVPSGAGANLTAITSATSGVIP